MAPKSDETSHNRGLERDRVAEAGVRGPQTNNTGGTSVVIKSN